MFRPTLFFVFITVLPLPLRAQGVDDARRWVAWAEAVQTFQSDSAYKLTQRAIPLLRAANDTRTLLKAYALRCFAAVEAADDSLMAHASEGIAQATRHRDPAAVAELRVCRGYAHEVAGEMERALADYEFGLAEGRRLNVVPVVAQALLQRGELRYYRGELNTALRDLNEAYALFSRARIPAKETAALTAIANAYSDSRVAEYEKALEYYSRVLAAHERAGSRRGIAETMFNLGATYEQMGRLEEGLAAYRRGLSMDKQLGDADEVATDERGIGIVLYKLKRPAEALPLFERALAQFRRSGNDDMVAQSQLSRGIALNMLGRAGEALADLNAARAYFTRTQNERFLERTEQERADAYVATGDWRRAYEARSAQLELQRVLNDRGREQQSARLRVQFDAEQKEQENRALLRENALRGQALADGARIRRLQKSVLALSAVVIAALAAFVWRQLRSSRRLRVTALTDELTGLSNRRHLLLLAQQMFQQARASGGSFGVLALDIDHFKRINDTWGHGVGDEVLRRVAHRLQAALRAGDHVARVGGEEFVALLPRASARVVDEIANRVREAIEQTDFSDLRSGLAVTVSVGAAVTFAGDHDFAAVHKRADDSLYAAKAAGRNSVRIAGAEITV